MLPREHRLSSGEAFRKAARNGRRAGGRFVVAHLLVTEEPDRPVRVGLVVSKAVGNAVTRNRVKRRLRHLARERTSTLPGPAVLVVRALPASAEASYVDLGADLDRVLARVSRP